MTENNVARGQSPSPQVWPNIYSVVVYVEQAYMISFF